ncbi:hypothetical protein FA15DRAFT_656388 [Coprinopsis marcescibilis]|uniref:Uncharacterized protein n=1 Tax=Coprinopsis marcescibilis TaxID=230819 RepID=A0A5C3KUD0_COPMA|nr:hypothetical protein FA15DRAFT_656388 [Coprinopsis marcescibilis]
MERSKAPLSRDDVKTSKRGQLGETLGGKDWLTHGKGGEGVQGISATINKFVAKSNTHLAITHSNHRTANTNAVKAVPAADPLAPNKPGEAIETTLPGPTEPDPQQPKAPDAPDPTAAACPAASKSKVSRAKTGPAAGRTAKKHGKEPDEGAQNESGPTPASPTPDDTNKGPMVNLEPALVSETKAAKAKHLRVEKEAAAHEMFRQMAEKDNASQAAKAQPQSVEAITNDTDVAFLQSTVTAGSGRLSDDDIGSESFHFSHIVKSDKDEPSDNGKGNPAITGSLLALSADAMMIKSLQAKIAKLERLNAPPAKEKTMAKKTKDLNLPLASGLQPAFRAPVLPITNKPKKSAAGTRSSAPANDGLGGFEDDNAEDICPTTPSPPPQRSGPQAPALQQSKKGNMMALIVQDPDLPVFASKSRVPAHLTSKKPVFKPTISKYAGPKKAQPKAIAAASPGAASALLPAPSRVVATLTSGKVQSKDLPDFAKEFGRWKDVFIPTLKHALFCSTQPFSGFSSTSPDFHNLTKELVLDVYPDSGYVVKASGDPIQLMAYNCCTAARNEISDEAVIVVTDFVGTLSTIQEAHELEHWVSFWSLCSLNGSGTFDALYSWGNLKRAVRCVNANGTAAKPTPFSQVKWGASINTYMTGLNGTTSKQWEEVMAYCDDALRVLRGTAEEIASGDELADDNCVDIFSFPSPCKQRVA